MSKLIGIVYVRTALSKYQVSLKKFRILIPWSVLTSPQKLLENRSGSHNMMYELEPAGSHKKVRTAPHWLELRKKKTNQQYSMSLFVLGTNCEESRCGVI